MKSTIKLNIEHFAKFPKIETERLILRQAKDEDASLIFSIRSNQKVLKYLDTAPHKSHVDGAAHLRRNKELFEAQEGFYWIVTSKLTHEAMGDFAIWRIDKANYRAEIGYTLYPTYWNKGYMTEAMRAILKFGFEDFGIHSFEANINPKNASSKKLLLKQGFEKEAYFKENYYFDGKFLDSEIYSLLQKNFKY